ncbi:CPBP family intramembrane glutamic endopeptidase [Paraurantiacibacter namhicola]|uniref:CAAX amino terminal protease self-immunity n=1 Tax=Paraurantiacibacter namhicola TaxID=645517 RepID=A0A1C7D6F9_9SPHN|nr:CPBP family intramembrane glutamic endopeptidase [Paraurantiacibacter namhicola]ANU07076.1 CAAX amino terminal protease self- immunity [Paraurantiacibacter namhicola]
MEVLNSALLLAWFAPVLLVALGLAVTQKSTIRWGYILAGIAAYTVYSLVGYATLPDNIGELLVHARWTSRLAQLGAGLAMVALAIRLGRSELLEREAMGLTLKQAPGSVPMALAGVAVLALLGAVLGGLQFETMPVPAAWAYHLTLPGLEEEILYRGLLTGLFAAGIGGKRALVWGSVLATLVFALGHAVTPGGTGAIDFSPITLAVTLFAGAILADMRLRTGSIVLPIIGHNLLGLAVIYA